jgi:hypothetical protein
LSESLPSYFTPKEIELSTLEQEAWWTPVLVGMLQRREKYLVLAKNQTMILQLSIP